MSFDNRKDVFLRKAVFVIICIVALMQIIAERGLYADGAYYLVRILRDQDFFVTNDYARLFVSWFTQFPTVFAVKIGITQMHFLIFLFSAWLIACPILFWTAALWKLRRDLLFWPFVAMFSAIFFLSNFFIIGEYNTAYAASAYCLAVFLKKDDADSFDLALLALAAAVLVMSYASTMFMGVLLAALALREFLRPQQTKGKKIYWAILTLIFALSVCVGTYGFLHPGNPDSKAHAMDLSVLHQAHIWLVMFVPTAICAQFFVKQEKWSHIISFLCLCSAALILSQVFPTTPYAAYGTRTFCGLALFIFSVCLIWIKMRHRTCSPANCAVPAFALLAVLASFDIGHSLSYAQYIADFRHKLQTPVHVISFVEFREDVPDDMLYAWCWTYPSMSVLLRSSMQAPIVTNPSFCPDPLQKMPDFSKYYGETNLNTNPAS